MISHYLGELPAYSGVVRMLVCGSAKKGDQLLNFVFIQLIPAESFSKSSGCPRQKIFSFLFYSVQQNQKCLFFSGWFVGWLVACFLTCTKDSKLFESKKIKTKTSQSFLSLDAPRSSFPNSLERIVLFYKTFYFPRLVGKKIEMLP